MLQWSYHIFPPPASSIRAWGERRARRSYVARELLHHQVLAQAQSRATSILGRGEYVLVVRGVVLTVVELEPSGNEPFGVVVPLVAWRRVRARPFQFGAFYGLADPRGELILPLDLLFNFCLDLLRINKEKLIGADHDCLVIIIHFFLFFFGAGGRRVEILGIIVRLAIVVMRFGRLIILIVGIICHATDPHSYCF